MSVKKLLAHPVYIILRKLSWDIKSCWKTNVSKSNVSCKSSIDSGHKFLCPRVVGQADPNEADIETFTFSASETIRGSVVSNSF